MKRTVVPALLAAVVAATSVATPVLAYTATQFPDTPASAQTLHPDNGLHKGQRAYYDGDDLVKDAATGAVAGAAIGIITGN